MGMTSAQAEPKHNNNDLCCDPGGSSIEVFFAESVILVTGATGFLGKALLEKLLRSCPRIAIIFVLIRPKKGQTIEQRFKELMDNSVFDRIRWEFPSFLNKVVPIKGDVSLPDLGLSPEDRLVLTDRVNIVFHSAATVRFNEPLKVAVNLNTKGTARMIDLCKDMRNLISVIHISTAYSNADVYEIKESIYKTKIKTQTVIDMCDNLDDETLRLVESRLIGKHPNTYTFTKGLAEDIVQTEGRGLPIAIVRPSIVCAAHQEPFPGWVDNVFGVTGFMAEIGRGAVRTLFCDSKLIVDLIPIDYVINTIICASWNCAMQSTEDIKVYNCTSGTLNPVRWHEFGHYTTKYAIESPTKYCIWYPDLTFRTNRLIHNFFVATFHFLPAFVLDLMLRFQGSKPVMIKNTKRYDRVAQTSEFFAVNEWLFHAGNMNDLIKHVNMSADRDRFNIDIRTLDWDAYMQQYMLGIRKYILKDNPDSLSKARSRLLKLYWVHKLTQISSILIMLFVFRQAKLC